ncbi:MAG: oleate hydratase [Aristaeellaceae bacterium]
MNRQPQYKTQAQNMVMVRLYAPNTSRPVNHMKKPLRECTGEEASREWLSYSRMPGVRIDLLTGNICHTTTCFLPYINAFFQPVKNEDHPRMVPEGSVNYAFLGQFTETPRNTCFTIEY